MVKRNYNMKKTISVKQFITEFGQGFSAHMKQRLLELGTRCILTRKDSSNILDLKHIEHIKYDDQSASEVGESSTKKEYAYGRLIVEEGALYFSESCIENENVMQIPAVKDIYESLTAEETLFEDEAKAKLVDEENIDFIIDRLLDVCPEVSAEHMAIIAKYSNLEVPKSKVANR